MKFFSQTTFTSGNFFRLVVGLNIGYWIALFPLILGIGIDDVGVCVSLFVRSIGRQCDVSIDLVGIDLFVELVLQLLGADD